MRLVAILNDISVWWHIVGVVVIVGALVILPDSHQSADFVFTEFVNNTGWDNSFYVVLLGLLLAQYTFTGYDASAHMTEETHDARRTSPPGHRDVDRGVAGRGWAADRRDLRDESYDGALGSETGVPPAQIFIDAIGETRQTAARDRGRRPVLLRHVVGDGELADYAFGHDGALPASNFWHKLNTRTRTPTNAIWLAAVGASCWACPTCGT